MMEGKAPKGRPYRKGGSTAFWVTGILLLQLAIGLSAYYFLKGHHDTLSPSTSSQTATGEGQESLVLQRQRLLIEIDSFNSRAKHAVNVDPIAVGKGGLPNIAASSVANLLGSTVSSSSSSLVGHQIATAPLGSSSVDAVANNLVNNDRVGTYVLPPPEYLMRSAAELEAEDPELAQLLKKHSNDKREIMLGLANAVMICQNTTICWWGGGNILESFLVIIERSNITNHLIGVMDEETARYIQDRQPKHAFQVNWFRPNVKIPASQANTREANRVSTLKFTLLQASMQMGYHTLITDMDLVYISNPFDHLYRDSDIESSSDGFDDWAYGAMSSINDPTMGWGGGGLYMKTFTINVGCAYIRATQRAFYLVKRVADSLAKSPGWDQQVFNEHLLTLAHGEHRATGATLRIMDIDHWVNSKRFFRSARSAYLPGKTATAPTPVLVHFNYHPDKHKRMLCIMDRYFYGKIDACDNFTGGSDPGS